MENQAQTAEMAGQRPLEIGTHRDPSALPPYIPGMLKFLIPVLFVVFLVVWWKIQAQTSGHALRLKSSPLRHPEVSDHLRRLAQAAGIEKVELRVLPDKNPNGLATDTGDIYVTQGFVDAVQHGRVTTQELASVAAHELGHVALGHMKRRMVEVAGRQAAHLVLGGILGRVIPFFGWHISAWLLHLITAKLSRNDEFEADAYATALMVRAGLGAEPQARLLEKLPQLIPGMEQQPLSWLASHPPSDERAEAIRKNAARWQGHAPALRKI